MKDKYKFLLELGSSMSKMVTEFLCPVMSGGNKRLSVSLKTCRVYKKSEVKTI